MTSLRAILGSANAGAKNLGRRPIISDRTNLVGEFFFGRDAATSIINMANASLPLSAPTATYGARSATITGAGVYFETGIADAQELTILAVGSFQNASSQIVGSYTATNAADTCALLHPSGGFSGQVPASDGTAQGTATLSPYSPLTTVRALALRTTGSADFAIKVDQFRAGARLNGLSETKTGKTRKTSAQTFRIGAPASGSTYVAEQSPSAVAIWHRSMTDAELLAAYQDVFERFAEWGVAV
ncbi:hypothetical protein [Xanthobacter flavus]|uniref:hypothetical protein n=1 Tax=Xanthobacter flavus TaxID=281 RepID=UPI00372CAEE5